MGEQGEAEFNFEATAPLVFVGDPDGLEARMYRGAHQTAIMLGEIRRLMTGLAESGADAELLNALIRAHRGLHDANQRFRKLVK